MDDLMNREATLDFLSRHVQTDTLMKHLLTVEASMRGYARKHAADENRWGIAGLLHDFDWEICPTPESHPTYGAQILRDAGYPEDIIRAVLTHGEHTGIPRQSLLEHTLFAVDELSGFIRAVALVRPSQKFGRSYAAVGAPQNEGQSLRQRRKPRRHSERRRRVGRGSGRTHRLCGGKHEARFRRESGWRNRRRRVGSLRRIRGPQRIPGRLELPFRRRVASGRQVQMLRREGWRGRLRRQRRRVGRGMEAPEPGAAGVLALRHHLEIAQPARFRQFPHPGQFRRPRRGVGAALQPLAQSQVI